MKYGFSEEQKLISFGGKITPDYSQVSSKTVDKTGEINGRNREF